MFKNANPVQSALWVIVALLLLRIGLYALAGLFRVAFIIVPALFFLWVAERVLRPRR